MSRREFTRNQREAIIRRAMNANGEVCCEKCGQVLTGKKREIDHVIPEALRPEADKQKRLTIADGQLLGACCHRGADGKTNRDVTQIAQAKRQNSKHYDRRIVPTAQKMKGQAFAITQDRADKKARAARKLPPPPRQKDIYGRAL